MDTVKAVPEKLRKFFEDYPKPALAFSGGADSSYLFYAAVSCGADVTAYFVKSQFQTLSGSENAKKTAELLNKDLHVLLVNPLNVPEIEANGENRCYLCKKLILGRIAEQARADKKKTVIDATNASDDPAERPGMKALDELGIVSPLRLCGLTKRDVRRLSEEAGLWTWNMPSDSCLATRIPFGTPLTEENLLRTEEAEEELKRFGFTDFRVRTVSGGAVLETAESESGILEPNREQIEKTLLKYYPGVAYGTRNPES